MTHERVTALRQRNSELDHEATTQLYMRLMLDPSLEGSEKSARACESLLAALRAELMTAAGGDTATPRKKKWWAVRLALMDVLLAYEEGHAFDIHLQRHDGRRVALIGMDDMTLDELKQQLQIVLGHSLTKSTSSSRQSTPSSDDERPSRRINWKHVWKNNCLAFEGRRLFDGKQRLVDIGIGSGACLTFADYRPPDPRGRHKY